MSFNKLINHSSFLSKLFSQLSHRNRTFVSHSNNVRNSISYLNWVPESEKTNSFSKVDVEQAVNSDNCVSFSRFILNYKNKVKELSSRISEIESFYKSNHEGLVDTGLEYEIIGKYAYYLGHNTSSLSLFRTPLQGYSRFRRLKNELNNDDVCKFLVERGKSLLDFSKLSQQGISNIKKIRISPGSDLIAIIYDPNLEDKHMLSIYSVSKGEISKTLEDIGEVYFMPYPKNSSFTTLYYTVLNPQKRSYKFCTSLIFNRTGKFCSNRLMYEDPKHFISLYKSKSGRVLFMATVSYNKVFSAYMITKSGKMFTVPIVSGSKMMLEYRNGLIYSVYSDVVSNIYTNSLRNLRRFKSMKNKSNNGSNFCGRIVGELDYIVNDIDMFNEAMVLYLIKPPSSPTVGLLKFSPLISKNVTNVSKPDNSAFELEVLEIPVAVGLIEPGINMNYKNKSAKFTVNTPGNSCLGFEVDLVNKLVKSTTPLNSNVKSIVLKAPTRDGSCNIPLTLVSKFLNNYDTKTVKKFLENSDYCKIDEISNRKCVLYVYGFYGENLTVCNYTEHSKLLEMGYTLCFAHVRGGGELGEAWREMGNKEKKYNSFYDLVDVIQFLISKNITSRIKLAISVSSASGILGGCLYNMRPDLCSIIIFKLPYLDHFTTLNDRSQPLVELEYEEFGTTEEDEGEEYNVDHVYSIDPCVNMKKTRAKRPTILINCNINDTRAPWYHTAKFLDILEKQKDNENILVKVGDYGHEGRPPEHYLVRTCAEEISIIDNFLKD
uniref:Prolyl endopeptidase n=1 Tax=Theileria annulata TaxID=5874 RepID=A0A3B0MX40_THEAN